MRPANDEENGKQPLSAKHLLSVPHILANMEEGKTPLMAKLLIRKQKAIISIMLQFV